MEGGPTSGRPPTPIPEATMQADRVAQHRWLDRLVGEWTWESESTTGGESATHRGTERVRSLGGVWVVCEGAGDDPGGSPTSTLMTLGFDPDRQKFVGTFVGSMMSYLWRYEGALDAAERVLALDTEGPSVVDPSVTTRYRDEVVLVGDGERLLTSAYEEGGAWRPFMTMRYRRVR